MKQPKVGYMEQLSANRWNEALGGVPRENLESAYHDLAYNSGVLFGLEVTPKAPASLLVSVSAGRSVYRDGATSRGKIAELLVDTDVNFAAYVPGSGTATLYLVIEPNLNAAAGDAVLIENAPSGTEDYDGAFTPYTLNTLERDEATLHVVSSPTGNQVALAVVSLAAGQTAITAQHISYNQRQLGSPAAVIGGLVGDTNSLKTQVETLNVEMEGLLSKNLNDRITALEGKNLDSRLTTVENALARMAVRDFCLQVFTALGSFSTTRIGLLGFNIPPGSQLKLTRLSAVLLGETKVAYRLFEPAGTRLVPSGSSPQWFSWTVSQPTDYQVIDEARNDVIYANPSGATNQFFYLEIMIDNEMSVARPAAPGLVVNLGLLIEPTA